MCERKSDSKRGVILARKPATPSANQKRVSGSSLLTFPAILMWRTEILLVDKISMMVGPNKEPHVVHGQG
jgi:hypothetical protein